jgi:cytoskeleton protein RodZ
MMSTAEMTLEKVGAHDVPISDMLKRTRLDRGFDLADVARETRIPLRHLSALESGNFGSLPALAYSIGFVRTYARYLGIDADNAARQYKSETTQLDAMITAAPPEMDNESRLPSRTVVLGSLAALATLAAVFIAYAVLRNDEAAAPDAAATADATARAPVAPVQAAPVLSDTAAPPVAETLAPPPMLTSDGVAGAPPAITPAPVPAASALPAMPSANGPVLAGVPTIGLVLRAKEDSWIKVSDGGPVSLKIGILKAGETYSVPQVPNLRLQTGNAGGLDVIYNGRLMPPLGAKGEVLRNKALDPAAMVAPPPPR